MTTLQGLLNAGPIMRRQKKRRIRKLAAAQVQLSPAQLSES